MSFVELTQAAALACAAWGAGRATSRTRAWRRPRRTSPIAQRDPIRVPIAEVVFADLRARAAEQKTTVSRLAAGLLTAITGHPEPARELDPGGLCLSSLLAHAVEHRSAHPDTGTRIQTEVRLPRAVHADIRGWTVRCASDAGQIAADLLAIATGHPEGIRHLDRLDMLRLASETLLATVDGITTGTHRQCTA